VANNSGRRLISLKSDGFIFGDKPRKRHEHGMSTEWVDVI